MTQQLNASYAFSFQNDIPKWANSLVYPPLKANLVRYFFINISNTTIHKFIHRSAHTLPINTASMIKGSEWFRVVHFRGMSSKKRFTLFDVMSYCRGQSKLKWLHNTTLLIIKSTLSSTAKFFWVVVRTRLSITQANNMVTWIVLVMLTTIIAELELNLAQILNVEIYERAFKITTTLPFPCFIFHLCKTSQVYGILISVHKRPRQWTSALLEMTPIWVH